MQRVMFRAGEAMFREGDPSDRCFKIVSGRVEICLEIGGLMKRDRHETVAMAGPGELIGEMSVIDRAPRSASAVAVERTICDSYTEEEILDVLQNDAEEALAYVRTLIRRLRHTNKAVSSAARRAG